MIAPGEITGLVLAGGAGSRMGGVDKGLLVFRGQSLVAHALDRLRQQSGSLLGPLLISANRHLDHYRSLGPPVLQDGSAGHAGPLAGVLAALERADTPWLLSVPCDAPLFPLDLTERLADALRDPTLKLAMAAGRDSGLLRHQPVFCLMRSTLAPDLRAYLDSGGRAVERWIQRHPHTVVPFERAQDTLAFGNANTPEELRAMEQWQTTP